MQLNILNIVDFIENKLNTALSEKAKDNKLLDNSRETFAFKLFLDAGDYKSFDYIKQGYTIADTGFESVNPTNKFCNYINGIVTVNESDVEGADSPILTFSTMLELLVPLRTITENSSSTDFLSAIRDVVDTAFSVNEYNSFEGFNMGMTYSLAGTGTRDLKTKIGDSISLYVFISFSFVSSGVNSTEIEIYVNVNGQDILIPALRKGYTRASNQESDIASDSTTGSAGCITSNTVFTLNFDKPVQKTVIDDLFRNYLLNGTIETYTVKIIEPGFNGNIETEKQMVISEVTRNTETTLNASETITMVEALV